MTERLALKVPDSSLEVASASLEVVREALARCVEATRHLLGQSADVVASAAPELYEMALRHADEHLQLSIQLASRLSQAVHLEEAQDIQKQFQTVSIYARQIRELSQLMTRFAPKAGPEEGRK